MSYGPRQPGTLRGRRLIDHLDRAVRDRRVSTLVFNMKEWDAGHFRRRRTMRQEHMRRNERRREEREEQEQEGKEKEEEG